MSMVATATEGKKFEPAPKGTYAGIITNVEMHQNGPNSKFQNDDPQVKITIEVKKVIHATPNRPSEAFPKPKRPQDFIGEELIAFCQFEPTPNNRAGKWIDGVRGYAIVPGEQFDWHSPEFLKQRVTIVVDRSSTGGQKILTIEAYQPDGEQAAAPAPQTTTLPSPAQPEGDVWDSDTGGDFDELPF